MSITESECMLYPTSYNIVLPPTPTSSDDEFEQVKQQNRTSLADLIPIASAALKSKQNIQQQESPLARALTKVKLGVQTRRLKERYLSNEWIRLALNAPVDESGINKNVVSHHQRTKEIARWYEWKYKKITLSLNELESIVDELRNQKLSRFQQQQKE
ncbi:hypothetical protein G6F56_012320 [Rhizopus delemar]|nr:hypothetical protein G6F56_012320 [Rhizopus delemar]